MAPGGGRSAWSRPPPRPRTSRGLSHGSEVVPTPTYVVECYWPEVTEEVVRLTLRRIASAARHDPAVERAHALGCIIVPTDGMVLFLFRAPAGIVVKNQSWLSDLPFDRIVESIQISVDGQLRASNER